MAMIINQRELKTYLESIQTFKLAEMIRKGRDTKSKYVTVEKGENGYLTDLFRARQEANLPSAKTWVARETILCNGKGNCKRACGGFGECLEDCDKKEEKRAKSGHRCLFRVEIHMYADSIGFWKVEFKGTHVPATVVWEAPHKNPLKEPETRKRAFNLISAGQIPLAKNVRGLLANNEVQKPSQKEMESFIQYHTKKQKKNPKLIDYSDSSEESDVDGDLMGLNRPSVQPINSSQSNNIDINPTR